MGKKDKAPEATEEVKEEVANASAETQEEAETTETEETVAAEEAEKAEEAGEEQAASEEAEETAEAETKEEPKKKERNLGWAKKNKKQDDEAEKKLAEANDKYLRLFAEFDNFRTRSEKEKSQMFAMGAKDVVEKILPILDSMEKGLAGVPEDKKDDPFVVGMDKVHKLFLQNLENMGVKPIEALGQEFNPEFHNAVMHVDDDSVGENIVVEEFQKGYMYRDQVVRFSMVKVAN